MKQTTLNNRVHQSFLNPSFYKIYLKESLTKAILFILSFSIICSIPFTILRTLDTKESMDAFESIIKSDDFPGFIYNDGELTSKTGESFLYEVGNSVVMFDTVGDYSIADLSKYEIGFLLDKTYMSIYSYGIEQTKINYNTFFTGAADNTEITNLISTTISGLYPLLFILLILSTIAFTVFYAAFIMLTAIIQRNALGLKISNKDTLKITLYSLVIPIAIYQTLILFPAIPGIIPLLLLFFLGSRKTSVVLKLIKADTNSSTNTEL